MVGVVPLKLPIPLRWGVLDEMFHHAPLFVKLHQKSHLRRFVELQDVFRKKGGLWVPPPEKRDIFCKGGGVLWVPPPEKRNIFQKKGGLWAPPSIFFSKMHQNLKKHKKVFKKKKKT
jgi:hypothetical protein